MTAVALRPLVLPAEHGGWGFLLEPVVLALLVAPSAPGLLIGLGALGIFLLRHPLKLAAHDWLRRRRYPRTPACELLLLGYGAAALAAFAGAALLGGLGALAPLLAAVPFGLTQFAFDARNHSRALSAELSGAIAPAAVAASIALAGGRAASLAAALALLVAARSVPAVLYVRSLLRGNHKALMLAAHAGAVIVAVVTGPWTAILAMCLLLIRAALPASGLPARRIGIREIGWGAVFVALVSAGFWI
ncbi:MAG TPA: YwiC-like family protein [Thermoanaerobaculia bacterium]|nr:YwiC-like family protein [Thermoanaerobaculia bacterium]